MKEERCASIAAAETHYEILEVSESSSLSEIKAAHRIKALKYHPDKQNQSLNQDVEEIETAFRKIQLAWECLRDEQKRQEYDDTLRRERERDNVALNNAVHVKLSEMECEICEIEDEEDGESIQSQDEEQVESQKLYSYTCRCGDLFEILEEELEDNDNMSNNGIWECNSCGLSIFIVKDIVTNAS
ncbi:hypothetical protein CTEN210_13772 [Chaetoceros tenuissimus]|uniref:Diphthamide biosynthesis protein 4 n=1 Tax=Chaetoceros tenuissimus TaxID=426638 RepID=A0AAD3D3Q6_9STRA|nr:hypothetical protein CTEN210_13772 [Chaetoceros tenuissimus]